MRARCALLVGLAATQLSLSVLATLPLSAWYNLTEAPSSILEQAAELRDRIVSLRRELHMVPELGHALPKTSALIRRELDAAGIEYRSGFFESGIVARLGVGPPLVALRADMDALPIQEGGELEYRSTHDGRMHACGHDGHSSMLMGAAWLLKSRLDSEGRLDGLPGQVLLVWQPDEEQGAGGKHMIEEGAIDGVKVAFGMHVAPWVPTGKLATRRGAIMAGALSFAVNVTGRGGHAAMPHLNVDPVVAAAALISSLQTLVSRETSPLNSAVLSVTLLRAGDAYNVIPDVAMFGGTIRALDHETLLRLQRRVEELAPAVASGFGCTAAVDWRLEDQPLYPPTVNDAFTAGVVTYTSGTVLGHENTIEETEPIMAGEDFSFFCMKVPCTFAFLGIRNETAGSVHALHNPRFTLDEGVLHKGAAMHTAVALNHLRMFAQGHAKEQAGANVDKKKDEL